MNTRALSLLPLVLLLVGSFSAHALDHAAPAPIPASAVSSSQAPLVWPSAPAEPRVTLESSFSRAADLGIRPSWGERFLNLVTGGSRGQGSLAKPCGLAVDEEGNVCVTDTETNRVSFFDLRHQRLTTWERIDKVYFACPVAVAKAAGVLYVADSGLRQVVAFDTEGRSRFRLSSGLTRPVGVAVSGDRLYVVDSAAHQVLMFDLQGHPLGTFGSRGSGPGEFNFPTHIGSDGRGRVYVTDAMNSRIQVFDTTGRCLGTVGSLGDGSGHFSRPKGVAVDSHGHLYVADALFDNIQVFDGTGTFLLDLGSRGSAPGEFWMPAGLAVGQGDRIYVADTCNSRVQVLRYIGKP